MNKRCHPHDCNCCCSICAIHMPPDTVGPPGPAGPRGAQGLQGPAGLPGSRGATGPQGAIGAAGMQGTPGEQGPQGLEGERGPTGMRGTPGTSVTILGSYDTVDELRAAHPIGNPGDSYLVEGDLYVWDEINDDWHNVGHIRGPIGPRGPAGPVAAVIPFSISKYGITLSFSEDGEPLMVGFSGFGSSYQETAYLQQGEWSSGIITIQPGAHYPTAFIMTNDAILRKIHVLFSTRDSLFVEAGAIIRPFFCVAISQTDDLVYRILPETIVYTEPYIGGADYPEHTIRKGALVGLATDIPEGALVALVIGIMGSGYDHEFYATFVVSGGLYIE